MDSAEKTLARAIMATDKILDKKLVVNLEPGQAQTEEFYINWRRIYEIKKVFGLKYLYALKKDENGKFIFIFDTGDHPFISVREEPNGERVPFYLDSVPKEMKQISIQEEFPEVFTEENEDNLFVEYQDAPRATFDAFETETLQYQEYTDKYGNFKSAFYPFVYKGKKNRSLWS